jgi:hypothetical protein
MKYVKRYTSLRDAAEIGRESGDYAKLLSLVDEKDVLLLKALVDGKGSRDQKYEQIRSFLLNSYS